MRMMVKKTGSCEVLKGKVMAAMFFEVSTRTYFSFSAAMQRLGGSVITMNKESSSAMKGESLDGKCSLARYGNWCICSYPCNLSPLSIDSVRMMQAYCDIIVIRHPMPGSAKVSTCFNSVPL